MIKLTQEEIWASNILNSQVNTAQAELRRTMAARDAFIGLLEVKYNAVFDYNTSTLNPVKVEKQEKEKKLGGK